MEAEVGADAEAEVEVVAVAFPIQSCRTLSLDDLRLARPDP